MGCVFTLILIHNILFVKTLEIVIGGNSKKKSEGGGLGYY